MTERCQENLNDEFNIMIRIRSISNIKNLSRNQQLLFTSNLRTKVRTALCQSNYLDYDLQMEEPHNEVHALVVGGHMGSIGRSVWSSHTTSHNDKKNATVF